LGPNSDHRKVRPASGGVSPGESGASMFREPPVAVKLRLPLPAKKPR
jgi:hypothetical protein